MTVKQPIIALLTLTLAALPLDAPACGAPVAAISETLHYADFAELAVPAEIVAKITISEALPLKNQPTNVPTRDRARVYVEGEIVTLFKGPADLSRTIKTLVAVPLDARGHVPALKKTTVIIFGRSVAGQVNTVQLIAPQAALTWSPERESLIRSILVAAADPAAPPIVTGIESAFSVAGTVNGEHETQIFLTTTSRPLSLDIKRRPNETPEWRVVLGEIVGDGMPPPPRNSYLWYQLACHLPAAFPADKLSGIASDGAVAIKEDYALVRTSLGLCDQTIRAN